MRRIASSRLMGFNGSESSSCHTSAGSRSSNGLRKLTGAPVTSKLGFGGCSDIEGEESGFDMSQSHEERAHLRVKADERKYFGVTRKTTGRQPYRARVVLHLGDAFHANTPLLVWARLASAASPATLFMRIPLSCTRL